MDYFRVMKLNNVEKLYHFTDRENLESIKKNGGLYSWDFCEKNKDNYEIIYTNLYSEFQ